MSLAFGSESVQLNHFYSQEFSERLQINCGFLIYLFPPKSALLEPGQFILPCTYIWPEQNKFTGAITKCQWPA